MDIEAVAEETPEKIHTIDVDVEDGVTAEVAAKLVSAFELTDKAAAEGPELFKQLYTAFVETDMALLEVNPFA